LVALQLSVRTTIPPTLFSPATSTYDGLKVVGQGDAPLPLAFECESAGSGLCSASTTLYLAAGSGGGGAPGGCATAERAPRSAAAAAVAASLVAAGMAGVAWRGGAPGGLSLPQAEVGSSGYCCVHTGVLITDTGWRSAAALLALLRTGYLLVASSLAAASQ
jgi:hypothetical protein